SRLALRRYREGSETALFFQARKRGRNRLWSSGQSFAIHETSTAIRPLRLRGRSINAPETTRINLVAFFTLAQAIFCEDAPRSASTRPKRLGTVSQLRMVGSRNSPGRPWRRLMAPGSSRIHDRTDS